MTTKEAAPTVQQFESNSGVRIYRIPLSAFPGFIGYAHLLIGAGVPTLVDTGSGIGSSTDDLLAGLRHVKSEFGESIDVTDIERIIITHGHIDHYGGLSHMLEATGGAVIGVHPLDRRVLTNYEERVIVATKDLTIYLKRAGVREERLAQLLDMYGFSKQFAKSVSVGFMIEEDDTLDGMEFYHVPGHCSGQVAIRLDDVLLSADHILSRTSPHVASESITHYTGLGHYRESLRKIHKLDGIRLTLGGHEDPIYELHDRIDYLQMRIDMKLERLMNTIKEAGEPLPILEISKRMFPDKHGFNVLLALQETGAFVEYLYDRGYLGVANLEEVAANQNPVIQYYVL